MSRLLPLPRLSVVSLITGLVLAGAVAAQQPSRSAQSNASFVVSGVVREVFQGSQPAQQNYLVQIDIQSSEARRIPPTGVPADYPGPGDCVYVHVLPPRDSAGRLVSGNGQRIPQAGAQVRAFLVPRQPSGWEGTGPDWFEVVSTVPAEPTTGTPRPPQAELAEDDVVESLLKMTVEPLRIKDQLALRVTSVERRGPAQQAGLEVGDIIVGIDGAPLANPDQIEALARRGAPFSLVVADVRSGRAAQVQVTPTPVTANSTTGSAAGPATTPAAPARTALGVSAESVSLGSRMALKVTRVTPGSPAEKSGLEPGDVIVEANGAPVTGPEQLVSAVRKSGPTLELTVRDSRTGRDTPVKVALGGAELPKTLPTTPTAEAAGTGASQLGIVTEMAFHNDEFAVKVTEVETGSPAARAGLRAGNLILAINGQTVLHPDDLTDAVRQAGRSFQLNVVDPATGREETVRIAL